MSEIRVVATMVAKPESLAAVETALQAVVAPSRQDPGCLSYVLHQDIAEPTRFVFIETWASQQALDAHNQTPHLQQLITQVKPLLQLLEVNLLRAI
jgi:quinol monooxygenase YgiN